MDTIIRKAAKDIKVIVSWSEDPGDSQRLTLALEMLISENDVIRYFEKEGLLLKSDNNK